MSYSDRMKRAAVAREKARQEKNIYKERALSAERRLADVIEYAEQVGIVRRATVLDLARGESSEK